MRGARTSGRGLVCAAWVAATRPLLASVREEVAVVSEAGRDVGWEDAEPAPEFSEFLRDVDGTGCSLTVFARELLLNAMHRGMDHVLVNVEAKGTGETAEKTANRQVYATRIDALSMLDLRDEPDESGRRRVTYCRFVTVRTKDSNSFKQESEAGDSNGQASGTFELDGVVIPVQVHYHFKDNVGPVTNLWFAGNDDDPNEYVGGAGRTDNSNYSVIAIAGGYPTHDGVRVFEGNYTRQ